MSKINSNSWNCKILIIKPLRTLQNQMIIAFKLTYCIRQVNFDKRYCFLIKLWYLQVISLIKITKDLVDLEMQILREKKNGK